MKHSHEWTLMYAHLGKHGRQDVHWHACFECEEMLFGPGVDCDGGLRSHRVNVDEIPEEKLCGCKAAASEARKAVWEPSDTSVRRLMPVECERLQGLPDEWTQLGGTADSKRYAALGDAVTANVAEWIGRRLMAARPLPTSTPATALPCPPDPSAGKVGGG